MSNIDLVKGKKEYESFGLDERYTGSVRRIEEKFNEVNSKVILGFNITRYRYGKWIMTIHFDPRATKGPSNPGGKKPITIYGIQTKDVLDFKRAKSPMTWYINNVAVKPNASGHGGKGWRYPSSEFADLSKNLLRQGIGGLKQELKEKFVPERIDKHIRDVQNYARKIQTNPSTLIRNYSKRLFDTTIGRSEEFKRTFDYTKDIWRVGVNVGEILSNPELVVSKMGRILSKKKIGRSSWGEFQKKERLLGKSFGDAGKYLKG